MSKKLKRMVALCDIVAIGMLITVFVMAMFCANMYIKVMIPLVGITFCIINIFFNAYPDMNMSTKDKSKELIERNKFIRVLSMTVILTLAQIAIIVALRLKIML